METDIANVITVVANAIIVIINFFIGKKKGVNK